MAGLKAQELRTHKSHANDMEGNMRDTKVFNNFFYSICIIAGVAERQTFTAGGYRSIARAVPTL